MTQYASPSYSSAAWTEPVKRTRPAKQARSKAPSGRGLNRRHLLALDQLKRMGENRQIYLPDFAETAKEVLGIVKQCISFDAAWVIKLNPQNFRFMKVYLHQFSRAAFSEYLHTFQSAIPTPRELKAGGLISRGSRDLAEKIAWRSGPFYKKLLEPAGLASFLIGASVDPEGRYTALICLWRSPNRRDFTPSDRRFFEQASGPCAAILRENRYRKENPKRTAGARGIKKPASPGIFVLGNRNEIVFMNEAAQAVLTRVKNEREGLSGEDREREFFSILHRVREKVHARHAGAEPSASLDHLFTFHRLSFFCRGTVLDGGPANPNLVLILVEAEETAGEPRSRASEGIDVRGDGAAFGLTDQEEAVAQLISRGLTNKEAASELGISVHTIKDYVKKVMKKLGVNTRSAITAKMMTR